MSTRLKQTTQIKSTSDALEDPVELVATPSKLSEDLDNLRFMLKDVITKLAGSTKTWYDTEFVVSIDSTLIDHDGLLNYDSKEHIDWTDVNNKTSSILYANKAIIGNGATTVDGTLSVTGLSSFGNAAVSGTLGVTGLSSFVNASIGGTLGVTGVSTFSAFNATGNATIGGTLGVTGNSTFSTFSSTQGGSVSGTLYVGGNLTVGANQVSISVATGTITAKKVVVLDSPTVATHAANKQYVDNKVAMSYRIGTVNIANNSQTITFTSALSGSYALSVNLIGPDIIPFIITSKNSNGFTVSFADTVPASGYSLDYMARSIV